MKLFVRLPWKCLSSQYLVGSPWKFCSLEVLKSLSAMKFPCSRTPFWSYCLSRCCSLSPTTSTFFINRQITRSSSVLVSRPCCGLFFSTDCQENIFSSFIHLLPYLSSQLFLSLSGYHPTDRQIADSHPFSTCPPSVECQRS